MKSLLQLLLLEIFLGTGRRLFRCIDIVPDADDPEQVRGLVFTHSWVEAEKLKEEFAQ